MTLGLYHPLCHCAGRCFSLQLLGSVPHFLHLDMISGVISKDQLTHWFDLLALKGTGLLLREPGCLALASPDIIWPIEGRLKSSSHPSPNPHSSCCLAIPAEGNSWVACLLSMCLSSWFQCFKLSREASGTQYVSDSPFQDKLHSMLPGCDRDSETNSKDLWGLVVNAGVPVMVD